MDVIELANRFRRGQVFSPEGAIVGERAMLTRKSVLVFTRHSVLKMRRPRLVDGYDQSMVSVRYGMTARERWVGRNIAPSVYLDDCVLQVSWEPQGFEDDAVDEVVVRLVPGLVEGEPVVAMRRLPDECRADSRLLEGSLTAEALAPFVELLATYQANAVCHREAPFGTGSRPHERWHGYLGALDERVFPSPAVRARLADETEGWLESFAPTFVHRVMEGRVRECHGGVSLEHLFVGTGNGVVLLDPEDGPDSERTIDVGEEVMRLAVELELGGDRRLGEEVLEHWAGLTRDITLRKVGRFFRRLALVRQAALEVRAYDDEESDLEALERARICVQTALED